MQTTWTDKAIIGAIQEGRDSRKVALHHVFSWRKSAINFIVNKGGIEQDAEEAFNDALIAFDKNIRLNSFNFGSSLKTYFMSILWRRWMNNTRSYKKTNDLEEARHSPSEDDVEDYVISEERKAFWQKVFGKMGERCQYILKLKQLEYTGEEMAAELGLKNAAMAKKTLYRCMEKLRAFFKEHPNMKDILN